MSFDSYLNYNKLKFTSGLASRVYGSKKLMFVFTKTILVQTCRSSNLFYKVNRFKRLFSRQNYYFSEGLQEDSSQVPKHQLKTLENYNQNLEKVREKYRIKKQSSTHHFLQSIGDLKNKLQQINSVQGQQKGSEEISRITAEIDRLQGAMLSQDAKIHEQMQNELLSIRDSFMHQFSQNQKDFQLSYLKRFLIENASEISVSEPKDSVDSQIHQENYIPNGLVLKKLSHTSKQGVKRQLLLAGLEPNNEQHCMYIKKLMERLKVKQCITMLPPDLPFLIKSEDGFDVEWRSFLRTPSPDYKFYVNPTPKTLSDIQLEGHFIPYVKQGMCKGRGFIETAYSMMQLNEAGYHFEHNPLLTGMVTQGIKSMYFCNYPVLLERKNIAMRASLEDMRQLIKTYAYFKQIKKKYFSTELLLPKDLVKSKFQHIISVCKTVSNLQQNQEKSGPTVLLCNSDVSEVLAEEWRNSSTGELEYNYGLNQHFLKINEKLSIPKSSIADTEREEESNLEENPVPFIEFIEKLVILDIVAQPLISKYFIRNKSFPYSCEQTLGGLENIGKVFLLWDHYFKMYNEVANGIKKKSVTF